MSWQGDWLGHYNTAYKRSIRDAPSIFETRSLARVITNTPNSRPLPGLAVAGAGTALGGTARDGLLTAIVWFTMRRLNECGLHDTAAMTRLILD